jgi:hypothetical protein
MDYDVICMASAIEIAEPCAFFNLIFESFTMEITEVIFACADFEASKNLL